MDLRSQCWLIAPDGTRRSVDGRGLLIGRGNDCDVLLDVRSASRQHALVRKARGGLTVVPLSGRSVEINGHRTADPAHLRDGARLEVAGAAFAVRLGEMRDGGPDWAVQIGRGLRHAVNGSGLTVGGEDDDLRLDDWPTGALRLIPQGGLLLAEIEHPLAMNGELVDAGGCVEVPDGTCFEPANLAQRDPLTNSLRIRRLEPAGAEPTASAAAPLGVTEIELTFLPRGGLVTVRSCGREHRLELPERPFDLIAGLLPSADLTDGGWVADRLLFRRIWGREDPGRERERINLLLHRTRRALVAAGLPGPTLLERAPGGGATRFVLAPACRVEKG